MKIIDKTILSLFLAVTLVACNSVESTAATDPVEVAKITLTIAKTGIGMTQTSIPTATYPPTVTPVAPTAIPPEPTRIPPDTYADKIDYAMSIGRKIYTLLPFASEARPNREVEVYSGCIESNDFDSFTTYTLLVSMETVNAAYEEYFKTEGWKFEEATLSTLKNTSAIGENPRIAYDVYRISDKDTPAFERLKVFLDDWSKIMGRNYIQVRVELSYVETKENLIYLLGNKTCPSWVK